jgi:hypothetical protein
MASDPIFDSSPLRLLVVVAQAARGEELRRRLAMLAADRPLELGVLAPVYARSKLAYLLRDVDEGIRRAHQRLERSVEEMCRDEVVSGEVGEAEPLIAIDDALVEFRAEEIVILPSPDREQCAESELFDRVRERFGLPVREIVLAENSTGTHARQTARSL